jgi:SPP1 family predicted phage head-tail adaptor
MDAGQFRYRIELNLKAFSQETDYGGLTESDTNVDKWAAMKWVQAKEKLQGGIFSSVRQATFTIRYSDNVSAVNSRDTITFDSSIFDIQSVAYKGLGNKTYIELIAQARE